MAVLVIFFDMEIGGVRFGVECGLLLRRCFCGPTFYQCRIIGEYGLEGDRERERERTEKGTYLGEILVLWCLFIRAVGMLIG